MFTFDLQGENWPVNAVECIPVVCVTGSKAKGMNLGTVKVKNR